MKNETIGSSNTKKFSRYFQIRWAEKLGNQDCPYLIRWTLIFFGFSIRLHHWLRSDDKRFYHDHSANFLSIVLKGKYKNIVPIDETKTPDAFVENYVRLENGRNVKITTINRYITKVEGIFNTWKNIFTPQKSIWFSKAKTRHYLDIPKEGAWTLLFEGRKYHKWGFYCYPRLCSKWRENPELYTGKNVVKLRPLKYFKTYGIIQDKNYQ